MRSEFHSASQHLKMWFLIKALLCVCILVGVQKIVARLLTNKRYEREAAARGCLPAPTLHSTNFLGTSRLRDSIAATKADRGPQYVVSAMNEVGFDVHTLRVPILDYELLVTRDPVNVQALFSSPEWDISGNRANSFMPLMGEGIFTSRGKQWKHSRALVRPQFARDQISNLGLMERHVRILLDILREGPEDWSPEVDLQPLFYYFTLDTATEFLYGQSVHSQTAIRKGTLAKGGVDGAKFSCDLDAAKHLVDKRGALGKFYWLMPMKKMNMHCADVHKVIDNLVDARLNSIHDSKHESKESHKFVLLDELAKETQDRRELRNETLHTLLAGRDTTGALLGWVFYFLARHPRVYAKLREIILSQFGSSLVSTNIHFVSLRNCNYIQYVMNEATRVAAIIPMNERIALKDTTLPRGGGKDGAAPIFVREGTQVLIPKYAMQHRPDIWGEDAEEFRPERWEGRKLGWEWVPFGGGPRKCLGRK